MEIRRLTENDSICDVSRVYALSWKAAYSKFIPRDYLCSIKENAWYEYLAGVLPNLWLASECGQIIGVCTYGPARDKACRAWGEIVSLYLLPGAARKGYGTKLLRAAMDSLFEMGCGSVYLWVFEDNHTARRFYEKNGFLWNGDKMRETIGGRELYSVRYVFNQLRTPHGQSIK